MTKHTPGPWYVVTRNYIYHTHENAEDNPDDIQVARVTFSRDAALVAAAPELLMACDMLVKLLVQVAPDVCNSTGVKYAEKVIAKARGE